MYTLKSGPLPSGPHLTFRDEEHLENSWVKVVCNQCGLHFSLGPAVAYPLVGELEIVVPSLKSPDARKASRAPAPRRSTGRARLNS